MNGSMRFHAGLAAEAAVARRYVDMGGRIAERRWRGQGGEIDLIARDDGCIVFVEVKKSRSFACAAEHLRPRQIARLMAAATEYLGGEPTGLDTLCRFDLALVDSAGRIEIIENALAA